MYNYLFITSNYEGVTHLQLTVYSMKNGKFKCHDHLSYICDIQYYIVYGNSSRLIIRNLLLGDLYSNNKVYL